MVHVARFRLCVHVGGGQQIGDFSRPKEVGVDPAYVTKRFRRELALPVSGDSDVHDQRAQKIRRRVQIQVQNHRAVAS